MIHVDAELSGMLVHVGVEVDPPRRDVKALRVVLLSGVEAAVYIALQTFAAMVPVVFSLYCLVKTT